MQSDVVNITFHGGVGEVTGANFLFETTKLEKNIKILVDCGLFQGSKVCEEKNWEPFPYDPSQMDYLFITHGHLDHVGRIPKLVKDGFKGKIYSTPPTKEIAELMLVDSLGVLTKEARRDGKDPFYAKEDVDTAMSLWETVEYNKPFNLGPIGVNFRDAGHILGSTMVEFIYNEKKVVFTGDLGNTPAPLLRPTETIDDANYIIMESVYGDRNHEGIEERKKILESVIENTFKKKGTLMIPAFSLERTQVILYEIERMMENNRIPLIPVFVDSPLAIKITEIYKKYDHYFNKDAKYIISSGNEIFKFPQLHFTMETEESKAIDRNTNPKIILAGSGMSNGGRIIHHEKRFLPEKNNTLLLIGYQAVRTMGRALQDGAKSVKIMGEHVSVRANIANIRGYSAHKDSDGLLEFVSNSIDSLDHVYAVMGEPKSALHFVQRIRDYLGVRASAPEPGDKVEISV